MVQAVAERRQSKKIVEQRRETRTDLTWPVSIWVPASNQFIHGQSTNISKSGVYIKLEHSPKLKPGNTIEINFPRTKTLAKQKGQYARIKQGTVVRVEQCTSQENASVGLGVAFEDYIV